MKFSFENIDVLDWKYTRKFGQDYNMDSELTYQTNHETVSFWNFFDSSQPEIWDDVNGDGEWDYVETIDVMNRGGFGALMVAHEVAQASGSASANKNYKPFFDWYEKHSAKIQIVFDGIEEFCKQRLSLTEDSSLKVPDALLPSIHQNPPWAYHRTIHFQAHSSSLPARRAPGGRTAAETAAEGLGMTKDRQDDIQNKIGLMMGGQGNISHAASEEEDL